ncbi:hypothetical protein GCM10010289_71810 [Streptomyces violascens]|nr:hypothetical protein GCM10010289_71810 [Streptomyces violascens]
MADQKAAKGEVVAKYEEQIDSIGIEPIVGGAVVSFASTRRESQFNPREGRSRVKSASVFIAHGEVRAICEALVQRESYRSPGDEDDAFQGFRISPWDGEPDVRGFFQYFGGGSVVEVDLSERTQSELLGKLQQIGTDGDGEVHVRFYDHRGLNLA